MVCAISPFFGIVSNVFSWELAMMGLSFISATINYLNLVLFVHMSFSFVISSFLLVLSIMGLALLSVFTYWLLRIPVHLYCQYLTLLSMAVRAKERLWATSP